MIWVIGIAIFLLYPSFSCVVVVVTVVIIIIVVDHNAGCGVACQNRWKRNREQNEKKNNSKFHFKSGPL